MAYNKDDAYKALTHLKEDYVKVNESIAEAKRDVKMFEENDTSLKLAKVGVTRLGLFLGVIFGLGMFAGFVSIVPFIIFASLCGLSLVGTLGARIYYNTLIDVNNKFLDEAKQASESMEYISSNLVVPRVDALQDVVHLNKPITKEHKEIIDEWKDSSAFEDFKQNPQKDDDIELY